MLKKLPWRISLLILISLITLWVAACDTAATGTPAGAPTVTTPHSPVAIATTAPTNPAVATATPATGTTATSAAKPVKTVAGNTPTPESTPTSGAGPKPTATPVTSSTPYSLISATGQVSTKIIAASVVRIDPAGNLIVLDWSTGGHNRIIKLDPQGHYLSSWTDTGLTDPTYAVLNFTLDQEGNVYLLEPGENSVKKFTPDGKLLLTWKITVNDKGFFAPSDLAVGSDGSLFVLYTGFQGGQTPVGNQGNVKAPSRVAKFSKDGHYLSYWGDFGKDKSQFAFPQAIVAGAHDSLYVLDTDNSRVQEFDLSGKFLVAWPLKDTQGASLKDTTGLALDTGGNFFVTTPDNNNVAQFDQHGHFLKYIKLESGGKEFQNTRLAVSKEGHFYLCANNDITANTLAEFDSAGHWIGYLDNEVSPDGMFDRPSEVATDKQGNVYILDGGNYRIQKFDSAGHYVHKWGSQGDGTDQFQVPHSLNVDEEGNIYLINEVALNNGTRDTTKNKIMKFDGNGTLLTSWAAPDVTDLAVGSGHVYGLERASTTTADTLLYHVINYDTTGKKGTKWGVDIKGANYAIIGADSKGDIFVVGSGTDNPKLSKYDQKGKLLSGWSIYNDNKGYRTLSKVIIDGQDRVYIASSTDNEVKIFDHNGKILHTWNTKGLDRGASTTIQGLAVDNQGHLYIVDSGNDRLLKIQLPD